MHAISSPRNATHTLAAAAVIAGGLLTAAGCRPLMIRQNEEHAAFPFRVDYGSTDVVEATIVGLDVENANGSVRVLVNRHFNALSIEARPVRSLVQQPSDWAKVAEVDWAHAEYIPGPEGRTVLRVTADPQAMGTGYETVEIIIRTPACDGLLVRNQNGNVEATGIHGAVHVHSGFAGGRGGDVLVRTDHTIVDPVSLRSEHGTVAFYAAHSLAARFHLEAPEGETIFDAPIGRPSEIRPTPTTYAGVINRGEQPVDLFSGEGNAVFMLTDDPLKAFYRR